MSNNFAVSSSDITSALTKQSASLAGYGNDLDKSIALVTSGTEIMTGQAGKVARGLRTIGANITQLAQGAKEFEITVNGATKTIQLWNETGTDMLDTYDVLQQISAEWEHMTNAEKSSLAITLAKKTQMDTFLAVMSNFEDAEKAYTTALLSEGSAWKENSSYMESVEAHAKSLQQQWEQLILSAPIEDLEKALLSAGTAILKFANSDLGQTVIKVTALITAFGLATKAVAVFKTVLTSGNFLSIFVHMLGSALAGTTSLTAAMGYLTTAMLSNPLFWGAAAIVGITAIVKIVDKLVVSLNEQREALEKSNEAFKEAQDEVDGLEEKLKVIEEQLDKVNSKRLSITNAEDAKSLNQQTKELKEQERVLKTQLAIAKAKAQEAEREAKAEAEKTKNKVSTAQIQGTNVHTNKEETIFTARGTQQEIFGQAVTEMMNLQMQIQKNEAEIDVLTQKYGENASQVGALKASNEELQQKLWDLQDGSIEYADSLETVIERLGDFDVTINGQVYSVQSLLDIFGNFVDMGDDVSNTNSDIANSTEEADEGFEEETEEADKLADALSEIQGAYDTLKSAVDEYNEKGHFTAETLAKLNELSPEYLAALVQEGNQYGINVDLLTKQFEAEKQEALLKLELAKNTALVQLAHEYMQEAVEQETTAVITSGNEAKTAAPKYTELATSATNAAIAMREVHDYLVGGEGDDSGRWEQFKKDAADITKYYDNAIDAIKNTELDFTTASKGNAGSHKDAWVEAFEEEKDALKNLLETDQITEYEYYQRLAELNEKYFGEISGNHEKYIKEYRENEEEIYKGMKEVYDKVRDYLKEAVEQGYEKAINALKKEEKAVLAEIKKQIEAIKKEKEEVIKGIEKQIKALKKEKEAVEKYYNDQIDAIKRENEVLQEQNELLEKQQELQKAKQQKVMVMQNGRFQLTENESAVSQAEQNLSNYEDQLSYEQQIQQLEDLRDAQVETIEERIEALEEYKEYMEEYYDEQIEAMEEYYDQVQEQYELQIEALQEELDTFKEGYQKEEDLENARLAAQVLGMNERKDLYAQELENLKNYINEVNRMLESLGEAGVQVDFSYSPITGYHTGIAEVAGVDMALETRASGDASFGKDSVALVGESPNAELLLGSNVNTIGGGKLMHLQKGTGVVNAESTQTLAGLLNGLATPQTNVANNRSTQQNFSFGTISLPNVTDADSFVNTLSHKFNNYAIQYGNTRK